MGLFFINKQKFYGLTIGLGLFLPSFSFAESMYVQSAKIYLLSEPKMSSVKGAEVIRGTALDIIKTEGSWMQVQYQGKSGWVSKLFLSKQKPVGQAELLNANVTDEKSSRKRTSDYAVSASARGFSADDRVREGREKYRANKKAVEKMEGVKVTPESLEEFSKSGNLGPN